MSDWGMGIGPKRFFPDGNDLRVEPGEDQRVHIPVTKATHEIKFEGENEAEVTIVIQPKCVEETKAQR
jgi:hypothetical protein